MSLHNQLGIVKNESTEEGSADVQIELKERKRSEKDIQNGCKQQHGNASAKNACDK